MIKAPVVRRSSSLTQNERLAHRYSVSLVGEAAAEAKKHLDLLESVLGGSWGVISGLLSLLIGVISIVTLLITLLITTHEPPSRVRDYKI